MQGELLSNVRALVALVLLGVSFPALGLAYGRAWRLWAHDGVSKRMVLGATAAAAVLRWLIAPKQIVTMYIGYLLTEQAIDLSASSHYGMGSLALYHTLFGLFPRDHQVLLWTNAVVGVLTLPLAASFAGRLLRDARAGAAFALLVAFTPLFVRNDTSDANHVPVLWWLMGGLVLWDEFLETGRRPALVAATALLALAANGRPEMPLLVPSLLVLFTVALWPPRTRLVQPAVFVAAAIAAVLTLPHALHVVNAAIALDEQDSLPGTGAGGLLRAARSLVFQDTVLTPSLYPVALVALALLGLLARPPGTLRARLAIAGAAVLWLGVSGLDLCRANMARVHVPGALLVTMLAGAGAAYVWRRVPGVGGRAALVPWRWRPCPQRGRCGRPPTSRPRRTSSAARSRSSPPPRTRWCAWTGPIETAPRPARTSPTTTSPTTWCARREGRGRCRRYMTGSRNPTRPAPRSSTWAPAATPSSARPTPPARAATRCSRRVAACCARRSWNRCWRPSCPTAVTCGWSTTATRRP